MRTERLLIRGYTPEDLDDVAGILADPDVFWWLPEPLDRAGSRAWLARQIREVRTTGTGICAIVLAATGQVIGGASLILRHLRDGEEIELGYHLGTRWWGKGYATEAARAMLAEARERGLSHVVSFIHPDNNRSQRVAERLGMHLERRITWSGLPHDVWQADL